MKVRFEFFYSRVVLTVLLAILSINICLSQNLRVGIYQNSPKVFIDEVGKPQGIFIDLIEEIARIEQWKLEYVFGTWAENLVRLQNEEIDVLLDMAFSDERAVKYNLNSIFVVDDWLETYTHKLSPIKSIYDLNGKTIAVIEGSIQEHLMKDEIPSKFNIEYNIITFSDYPQATKAILDGTADAMVASRFFYFSIDRNEGIISTAIILRPSQVYFAFPRDKNEEVMFAIDRNLASFKNDPNSIYYATLNRWLSPIEHKPFPRYLWVVLIILSILIISFGASALLLRQQVKIRTEQLFAKNKELQTINNKLEGLIQNHLRIEEELNKFRFMVENARQEVYLVHPNGELAYANNAASTSLGYTVNEIMRGGIGLFDKEYGTNYYIHFNELKQNELPPFETIHISKEGKVLNKLVKSFYLKIGEQEFICGFAEDITERKKVEKALIDSQHLFETLANMSPVGIFRTRADGYTTYVNPRWCEISGLTFEEALGDGWLAAVHPDDKDETGLEWKKRSKKGVTSEAEYRFQKADGTVIWVLGHALPEMDGENIIGYIGTITDITERKIAELLLTEKAEEIEAQTEEYKQLNEDLYKAKFKAEESDRLKSAFLANMSHEIRTPMNAICGFSRLLERPNLDEDKKKQFVDLINSNSQQLLSIINDIIDISKIESGVMNVNLTNFSINTLFEDIFNSFSPLASQKELKLIIRKGLPDSKSIIRSDETKLKQILNNLIGNSIKFTNYGQIEFEYTLTDNRLNFMVKDTGIGIPVHWQKTVFDRFQQVQDAITDSRTGTGLGLPISKAFVELLGGEIWLESIEKVGTTFYFTIPYKIASEKVENTQELTIKTKEWSGKTILLVEDDEPNQFYIFELLKDTGVNIIGTDNGEESVRICQENNEIDLVLMDLKLINMSGLDATREIKKFKPNLPIIAQTAYAFSSDMEEAKNAGCDDFISKPIDADEFFTTIRKFLD